METTHSSILFLKQTFFCFHYFFSYIYLFTGCVMYMHTTQPVWKSVQFMGVGFPFYHMGSGDGTQVVNLGGKHLYQLSHLVSPEAGIITSVLETRRLTK